MCVPVGLQLWCSVIIVKFNIIIMLFSKMNAGA